MVRMSSLNLTASAQPMVRDLLCHPGRRHQAHQHPRKTVLISTDELVSEKALALWTSMRPGTGLERGVLSREDNHWSSALVPLGGVQGL